MQNHIHGLLLMREHILELLLPPHVALKKHRDFGLGGEIAVLRPSIFEDLLQINCRLLHVQALLWHTCPCILPVHPPIASVIGP